MSCFFNSTSILQKFFLLNSLLQSSVTIEARPWLQPFYSLLSFVPMSIFKLTICTTHIHLAGSGKCHNVDWRPGHIVNRICDVGIGTGNRKALKAKKSNLYYTRSITPKRGKSGGSSYAVQRLGNKVSKKPRSGGEPLATLCSI